MDIQQETFDLGVSIGEGSQAIVADAQRSCRSDSVRERHEVVAPWRIRSE